MFQEGSWPILVIMGVFFILMIVMNDSASKKAKKKTSRDA